MTLALATEHTGDFRYCAVGIRHDSCNILAMVVSEGKVGTIKREEQGIAKGEDESILPTRRKSKSRYRQEKNQQVKMVRESSL